MEGRGRSSAVLLFLALALVAASLGAVAAQLLPPAGKRYMLITLQSASGHGSHAKLAVKTGNDVSIPGFANKKQKWFAVRGSEDLVPPGYRRRDITGGLGLFSQLVGALVNDGGTRG